MNKINRLNKRKKYLNQKSQKAFHEFLEMQKKIQDVEAKILVEENQNHIPHID